MFPFYGPIFPVTHWFSINFQRWPTFFIFKYHYEFIVLTYLIGFHLLKLLSLRKLSLSHLRPTGVSSRVPQFVHSDASFPVSFTRYKKVCFSGYPWLTYFFFLEFLKYAPPFSLGVKCCCWKVWWLFNFISFWSNVFPFV